MSASVGSTAFFAASLLLISVLVLLLLRYYLPLRSTPAYLLVPVFLALVLPASIVILVPIDLASSAVQEDGQPRGVWMPEEVMLASWRIAYWLIFVLTWYVSISQKLLQIILISCEKGYTTTSRRICRLWASGAERPLSLFSQGQHQVSVDRTGLFYCRLGIFLHLGWFPGRQCQGHCDIARLRMGSRDCDIPDGPWSSSSTSPRLQISQHIRVFEAVANSSGFTLRANGRSHHGA